ncbi:hypothetical protein MSS93_00575 [Deinococcus radiodurans]|nr:hypothetical protein MSS93_00575 [Deinococcus radiodurans]
MRLHQTLYQNEPLNLSAQANWRGGLRASGLLTRRGLRLPVTYDPAGLRVRGARLDARLLSPVLSGAAGEVGLDLTVPGGTGPGAALDWARATGQARLNVRAQGQAVTGLLALRGGELDGALKAGPLHLTATRGRVRATGDLAGHHLEAAGRLRLPGDLSGLRLNVSGPYLSAAATGDLRALRGTLRLRPQTLGAAPPAWSFRLRASRCGCARPPRASRQAA